MVTVTPMQFFFTVLVRVIVIGFLNTLLMQQLRLRVRHRFVEHEHDKMKGIRMLAGSVDLSGSTAEDGGVSETKMGRRQQTCAAPLPYGFCDRIL